MVFPYLCKSARLGASKTTAIILLMNKPTVGVFFGSRSAEHDVSIVTALSAIIKPLELSGNYKVVPVYIDKKGRWFSDQRLKDIATFSTVNAGSIESHLSKLKPIAVRFDNGLSLIKPGVRNQITNIDIAFPATHGTHGEDGELMGVFEMAGVPYIGCGVLASATAMDKVVSKLVAEAYKLPTPKFQFFTKTDFEAEPNMWLSRIEKWLRYPLFVKPAHLGSSIAITRVSNRAELENAIEVALHYDNKALVEESVDNLIEVTLPIRGNDNPEPALLEKPLTTSKQFFDFDTKYMGQGKGGKKMSGGKRGAQGYSQIPADISKELYDTAVETGLAMYKAIGCEGIARVDMLIDGKEGKVYFNEVNPLPGSLYAHNWRAKGVSGVQLVDSLVKFALERQVARQSIKTSFDTNFLKQFS